MLRERLAVLGAAVACLAFFGVEAAEQPPGVAPKNDPSAETGSNDGNGMKQRGRPPVCAPPEKLGVLLREIDESDQELQRLRAEHRLDSTEREHWEIVRPLELARKAEQTGLQRDLLECLVRSTAARSGDVRLFYSRLNMSQRTLAAVAWLIIIEKNLREIRQIVDSPGMGGRAGLRGVESVLSQWSLACGDLFEAALIAIDSFQDDRARDCLLELALEKPETAAKQRIAGLAWSRLRSYDARPLRPQYRRAMEAAEAAAFAGKKGEAARQRAVSLALRSWDEEVTFVESLAPDERRRYHRVQSILSCSHALACPGARVPPRRSAGFLVRCWHDGDERFLPHLLASGGISDYLLLQNAPISPKGLAWLNEQANSDAWPASVKEALTRLVPPWHHTWAVEPAKKSAPP